jgi:universal stress protein A
MKTSTIKLPRSNGLRKTGKLLQRVKHSLQLTSMLVPIDFSDGSVKALSYAAALAEQFNARLTLLYVIEPMPTPDFEVGFPFMIDKDQVAVSCKKKLSQLAAEHSIEPKLVEKVLVREGRPFHEITEVARSLKMDVIVIATHGYTGLNHVLMGSVAERVVRHAPCPVLVVREREHDFLTARKERSSI